MQVSEDALYNEFAVFGNVRSIKIMWPRTDEEKMRCQAHLACMAVDLYGCGLLWLVWLWISLACMAVDFFGLYGCGLLWLVWLWISLACMAVTGAEGLETVALCHLKTAEQQNRPLDRWMEKMCKDQQ